MLFKHINLLSISIVFSLMGCDIEKPIEIIEAEKNIPELIDYNLHVRPILSDKCFHCHGPDTRNNKAGLRLDIEEAAYAELAESPGKFAIVSHNLYKSEVYRRITARDNNYIMPPKESNLMLTSMEKAILVRWIEQGAEYKPHWAFTTPVKHPLPEVNAKSWIGNDIDYFILNKIERHKLSPSEKADKETLIRRASFDLVGLPPSLEEIEAFLADNSDKAYERVVDRLLASKHFGERMATYWLDLARYADSEGYLDDHFRRMWPWRDWVINAFNNNKPFNQFIVEQIGGDQIPNATKSQVLATAFNRLHKINTEAGIIDEEFRVETVADRTNTVGKAILGLTLECAKCHDHKFDPISQKEYYQFYSFFNSTEELGSGAFGEGMIDPGPTLPLTDEETDKILAYLRTEIKNKEKSFSLTKTQHFGYEEWLSLPIDKPALIKERLGEKLKAHYTFDKEQDGKIANQAIPNEKASMNGLELVDGKHGMAIKSGFEGQFIAPHEHINFERIDPFSISIWVKPSKVFEETSIFYNTNDKVQAYRGYDLLLLDNKVSFRLSHAYPYQALQIVTLDSVDVGEWSHVSITYDGTSKAQGIEVYVNGEIQKTKILRNRLYKSAVAKNAEGIYVWYPGLRIGNRNHITPFDGLIDELKIFNGQLSHLEVLADYNIDTLSLLQSSNWPHEVENLVIEYYNLHDNKNLSKIKEETYAIRQKELETIDPIYEIMVLGDLPEPRETYVLNRGVYDDYGEKVERGTLAMLPDFSSYPKNRYGLGLWLTSENHPLTSRVAVNRFWQLLFGKGLVNTSDDFGLQGSLPTHPYLLDWLAVHFIELKWDVKALLKMMVMSSTYQQSSKIRDEVIQVDPENKLIAQSPRYRMTAEMIRDNALFVSELLVDSIGGPTVRPYQPPGLWKALSNEPWAPSYIEDKGQGLYRRSLYTVWKRNAPPPSMLIFDAPDRGVCRVKRHISSSPLQALVLLNDPQYVEACRVLAERLMVDYDGHKKQIVYAFRLLTGRKPIDKEMRLLTKMFEDQKAYAEKNIDKLSDYLSVGKSMVDHSLEKSHLAALSMVCNTIMNSSEGYYKK